MKNKKMKIRKSVSDRFRITKNGKVLFHSGFGRHLKSAKSKSQKRKSRVTKELKGSFSKKIKKILGK